MAADAGARDLELRLLGPLELVVDGEAASLGGPMPRALVALLALELGRTVSVDRIVEELWPEGAPRTARHALRVYVSQLRRDIPAGLIVTRPPGYLLALAPECVDAHRFGALVEAGHGALAARDAARAASILRSALALWHGEALEELRYAPFAQVEIARLEERRLDALEDRVEADLALGGAAELVAEVQALVADHPLRERLRGLLMLALYRAGRQSDALDAYRDARRALVDGLGIEPGRELRDLHARMLRQDESLVATAPAPAAPRSRRIVTVLSAECSLGGDEVDAEVEHRELQRATDAVAAAVARHGGSGTRGGDGSFTAAFGATVAREDDALRAAVAAVEARDAVEAAVALRVGVETGEVLAGGGAPTGRVVRDAVALRTAAAPGEILLGERAVALVRHAARLEPRATGASALLAVEAAAPAFARRLDSPLVGRERELAALRAALREAVEGTALRVSFVLGPAGIGKSRLVRELVATAEDVTVAVGRCVSYGEGMTYWPLRSLLADAAGGSGRDELAAALDGADDAAEVADALAGALEPGDEPVPAAEIAWAFRRLCESLGRRRPLVVVLDDLHWAEPAFLELVQHLVDHTAGVSLHVVAVAREELPEDRVEFLADGERIVLGALEPGETETLLARLAEGVVGPELRGRILEAAEGNPLYLEQLVALGAEGGFGVQQPLPATIQALLVARLDRLGPAERSLLERAAVVGRDFAREALAVLVAAEAEPAADRHLETLVRRGFLDARPPGSYRFRHALLQEAVSRATPKSDRAELHERVAGWLDGRDGEPEELVGYHFERAAQLRRELGVDDERTRQLALAGGRRLARAGVRALKRGDVFATVNLLERARALLLPEDEERREALCELAIGLRAAGDAEAAAAALGEAVAGSVAAGDRRLELRARLELAYVRLLGGSSTDDLLELAAAAIPFLESVGDERALGRTWLFLGWVHGGIRCDNAAWEDAASRALRYYRRSGWPTSTCLGEIAAALYYGPTPVPEAIERCEELLRDDSLDRGGRANVLVFLGGLEAQRGRFEHARQLVEAARSTFDELGQHSVAVTHAGALLADVETAAGDTAAAAAVLREVCARLERTGDFAHLASRAGDLAEVLYREGRLAEAEAWAATAERHAQPDDVDAQVAWRAVRAKLEARRGGFEEAEALVADAVARAERVDALNDRARVLCDHAEVLGLAGRAAGAAALLEQAAALYERKGNVVGAERTRALVGEGARV